MKSYVIAIDQSTSSTKALLFDEDGVLVDRADKAHKQYYPKAGWVEHNPDEIYDNTVKVITDLVKGRNESASYTLAITNQRETVVVWDRKTGIPVYNAVVWQCLRGQQICDSLVAKGLNDTFMKKTGLFVDPYFSASGVCWILDNVPGAREKASRGELCMGTIDSYLIFRLTGGKVHATDYTNASRTLLFNIHTLTWDEELLGLFNIPSSMVGDVLSCDSVFGETTVEGLFDSPVQIAGVLGDSHGALAGQMCFGEGHGKVTYGTGSSVMVNIGESVHDAPKGLVTSVGFAALGKVFYAFEGNIHCTGATVAWLKDQLQLIDDPGQIEAIARSVSDNGGVYFIPAFAGLGAPWWNSSARARISGLTLSSTKAHVCRAALESIAYQVADLVKAMTETAGVNLKEIRVDGGPTNNGFLMSFQSDLLNVPILCSEMVDACAYGAFVMNGFARRKWKSFKDASSHWNCKSRYTPDAGNIAAATRQHQEWQKEVTKLINK